MQTLQTPLIPQFPPDFSWGVATSAFQIEGATQADGRGPSIWDTFSATPGKVVGGDTGEPGCEHYSRWRDDVEMIAGLGVNAYRFSIAWPRVQPQGRGAFNPAGLAFYDALTDALLDKGIAPHLTLYHWDLPQALQDTGGWLQRDTTHRFADYAAHVASRLGDRVASIATHNEPWCAAVLGHQLGIHAPGLQSDTAAATAAHHLLLSHGLALQAMRAAGVRAPLGIVLNQSPATPASQSAADQQLAEREYTGFVRWFLEPLLLGRYPSGGPLQPPPDIDPADLATIAQPLDFLGINYYTRIWSSTAEPPVPAPCTQGRSDSGWEIYPQGLAELLLGLARDHTRLPPIYICENGMAEADQLQDGRVHDPRRTAYLQGHLLALHQAMVAGVDVRGYFCWSLMDNFEWAEGYSKRFGLVHVDYASQRRTLKDSALWYRDMLARQSPRPFHRAAPGPVLDTRPPSGAANPTLLTPEGDIHHG